MAWVDTLQELSWAYQAADMDSIDPITDGTKKNWRYGIASLPAEMPIEEHERQPIYYGSSRDPSDLVLARSQVNSTIGFVPTTAIGFYQYLGGCSTDGSNIHTISGIETGNVETIMTRQESYGTVNKYWSALNNKLRALTFTQDLRNIGNPAGMALGFLGTTSLTATHNAHYAPVYPTDDGLMNGTELDKPYLKDSRTSMIWDFGGDAVEYIDALLNFTYQGTNSFQPHPIQNQAELEYIYEGHRIHDVSFEIRMGKDSSIFDDFHAGTLHAVRYKVYNTATNYLQLDIAGIGLKKPQPTYDLDRDKRVYFCTGKAKTIIPVSIDGITQAGSNIFYGESH